MNPRPLRYFIAIADAGSLTAAAAAAADAIALAQPALTRQTRELESGMGAQLLLRMPRGVRLTQGPEHRPVHRGAGCIAHAGAGVVAASLAG